MEIKGKYNRIINLEFRMDSSSKTGYKIVTPTSGMKPDITIEGSMTSQTIAQNFNIRIKNLYAAEPISAYKRVTVYVGYQDNMELAFDGEIFNIYVASPGPDRETVIQCTTAGISSVVHDFNFTGGSTLSDILTGVSKKIGYDTPDVADNVANLQSGSPVLFQGTVTAFLQRIKSNIFPGVDFTLQGKKIRAATPDNPLNTSFRIKVFKSAPQITGSIVSFVAHWNPQIKVDDTIYIDSSYFSTQISDDKNITTETTHKFSVSSISFKFSTVGDTNEMTIQGTTPEAKA